MEDRLSIAVAQTIPVRGDVGANVAQHLRLVPLAAEEKAQVLVFPELSLTGYEMDLAEGLAFSKSDPRLDPLLEAASTTRMTLIAGAPVRIDGRLHIGAFILRPDRSVGIYTKHHLGAFGPESGVDGTVPPAEAAFFTPGTLSPLVPLCGGAAAVAICADTGRPSHPRDAAARGARAYLASMFVIPSALAAETSTLRDHAARHSMTVAFANYGGPTGGLASGGRSAVWSPRGDRLAQLDPAGAGVAVATGSEAGWSGRAIMLAGA